MSDKKVLVIGAGRSGVAVSNTLLNHGYQVVLTDAKPFELICEKLPMLRDSLEKMVSEKRVELCFGSQFENNRIDEFEKIVVSPGVPSTIPIIVEADEKGFPVISEVELSYLYSKTPFIGITGTNGKTTTTTLVGEIFKNSQKKTYVVGNIGTSVASFVDESTEKDIFVTELSSFQLQRCYQFHPIVSAVLNLSPDHLDRHGSLENYYQAKLRVCMNQNENDYVILNADDGTLCELTKNVKTQKIFFSIEKEVQRGAFLKDEMLILRDDQEYAICSIDELGIKGPHNVMNALAAVCIAYFGNVSVDIIRQTLMTFKGVEHRQERFAHYNGVEFINDSKGTNTDATITALKAMTKPTILIAGGYDKKEDYTQLVHYIKEKVKLMILIGVTADEIEKSANEQGFISVIKSDDFEKAVETACHFAESGDVVLLSPACASWDMFDSYEQRGRLFKSLVERYAQKE